MSNTTPDDVEGTYAEYLLLLSKASKENREATQQARLNAALDADEIAKRAIRRLDAFLDAVEGQEGLQLLAEGALGVPGVEGTATGLFLDDLRVAVSVIHRRAGHGRG